jgi:hypothetical protein
LHLTKTVRAGQLLIWNVAVPIGARFCNIISSEDAAHPTSAPFLRSIIARGATEKPYPIGDNQSEHTFRWNQALIPLKKKTKPGKLQLVSTAMPGKLQLVSTAMPDKPVAISITFS